MLQPIHKVNMSIRPIRFRYPIQSQDIGDMFDHIYFNLVDLLGYQNNLGNYPVTGSLRGYWSDLDAHRTTTYGSNASGYLETISVASGTLSSVECKLGRFSAQANAMFNNTVV